MKIMLLAFFMLGLFYQNSYSCLVQLKNGNSFSGSGSCQIINDKVYLGTAGSISFYRSDVKTIDGKPLDEPALNNVHDRSRAVPQKQEVIEFKQNNSPNVRMGNQYPPYYPTKKLGTDNNAPDNTKCVEETIRTTGKPRDEVVRACNQVLSKPPIERQVKLPITYEEKIAQKEDILNWGLKNNVPSEEVKKVMELYGVLNIAGIEKDTNGQPSNNVNMPVKSTMTSSMPVSDGEAWIEYPDGTRKRVY